MNILKKFMDSGQKQELMMLPSGQFLLLRSEKSPKSSVECIYNDATLGIREAGQYTYELLVKKNADEADVSNGDGSDNYSDDAVSILSTQSKKKEEEWVFSINEGLNLHKKWSKDGEMTLVWENTIGDEEEEKVQFITTRDISFEDTNKFIETVYKCQYEAKYKETASNATAKDLADIASKSEIRKDIPIFNSSEVVDTLQKLTISSSDESGDEDFEDAKENPESFDISKTEPRKREDGKINSAPKGKQLFFIECTLSLFDPVQDRFCVQEKTKAAVIETGEYEFWLAIEGREIKLGTDIVPNINPTFDFKEFAFIFNYEVNNVTLSYMLQFKNSIDCRSCQIIISKCLWLTLNRKPWSKCSPSEKDYILHFSTAVERDLDTILTDSDTGEEQLSDDSSSEDENDEEYSKSILSSESFKETSQQRTTSTGNKSLTVAYKNSMSYIVRDNKIGVFKTDGDDIEFVTSITNITDLKGKRIDPRNPMLYMEDRNLVIQDPQNKNTIFKMDIEREKIIEEWGTGDRGIVSFGPAKKFDQLSSEQTFLGISQNEILKIDPRLNNKDKVVSDDLRLTVSQYRFSAIGTTADGYIAVGSEKGDIRLYDRLNIRAKTAIPSLGKPIRHITISAEGEWLLCTCDTSLLLFNLEIKNGPQSGNLGFLKSFPRNEGPKPYILTISPEHASFIVTSTKNPIKFTKAHFNTGVGEREQTIVTSTGSFAVSWSLKKIIKRDPKPYVMKKYGGKIAENNFEFGTDRNVIVALKDDVSVSKIRSFKKPTKEVMNANVSLFYHDENEEED